MIERCDVAVIGQGPAGLMAAAFAAQRGLSVIAFDKNNVSGRKLRITGKGRCNVTCDIETGDFFDGIRRGARFLNSSVRSFSPHDIMNFFENLGVPLVTERGARVFPQSGRADDIADALEGYADDCGVRRVCAEIMGIEVSDGAVTGVKTSAGVVPCRAVIVATGGVSYPGTGSTGDGYRFAKKAGIAVNDISPALVPVVCPDKCCAQMQGLSLRNVTLSAEKNGKVFYSQLGEMLFTHFGISGPIVLTLSSYLADIGCDGVKLHIDLKPALDEKTLDARVLRDFSQNLNRDFKNSLDALLPGKLIPVFVERSGINPQKKINSLTAAERGKVVSLLKDFPLGCTSLRPASEAIITAGGVELTQLDPKTMMSKSVKNLHFAGEVIDADGYTGGYNLTIAFATGRAAGVNVLEEKNK